ncbi:CotS family spore coat protein [Sporolactobacillus sp. THM7-4]|nr:CotS family spore coat protein [Sporolactobacillus sp. THM7-4]
MNKEAYAARLEQEYEKLNIILQNYPITPGKITLLSTRGGRSKWRIETDRGNLFLRQEYINPRRMLFIAGAHWHLQKNGLPIAKLIPTKSGGLCLSGGDHAYLLYEAHEGEPMLYYDKTHAIKTMEFIGKFHQASKGYVQPEESKRRTRSGKWHKLYRWKLQELESNKKLAESFPNDAFSLLFLEQVDKMLKRGYESLSELDQPYFEQWTKETIQSRMFCQQDFTMARMILKDDQPFMKDLHSITIDFPTKDLRILLNKLMKKLAVWDENLACQMLTAYDQVHPLSKENYRVLWTDLKFPHLFCAISHKYYLGQKRSWGDEKYLMNMRHVMAVENSKEGFLNQFDEMFQNIKGGGTNDIK